MSDTKLRDLERRWKKTGTVEDEAAYLLERVRVGDLTSKRLEAAACLGHDAAQWALGGTPPGTDPLTHWWLGYDEHKRSAGTRWSRVLEEVGPSSSMRAGIAMARAHAEALGGRARSLADGLIRLAELEVATSVAVLGEARTFLEPDPSVMHIAGFLWPELIALPQAVELERRPWRRFWGIKLEGDLVRISLHRELVPWCLGVSDPVHERVNASRGSST